jgi:hypothetical protein
MKKCIGESIFLAQDKVIWGNGWYDEQDGKNENFFGPQVGVL